MTEYTIAVIGCGRMGSAMALGVLDHLPGATLRLNDSASAATAPLQARAPSRVVTCDSPAAALAGADVALLAIKPHGIVPLIRSLSAAPSTLLISVAAGLDAATLNEAAGPHRVLRTMPNTPALVGEGVTAVLIDDTVTASDRALAVEVLGSFSEVIEVAQEHQFDAITALSGSGPAFVAMFAEALADGAVVEGLPRPIAAKLARLTLRGTAALLAVQHPGALKDAVGSPGGTTMAGVAAAEKHGLRSATIEAIRAAARRSRGE